MECCHRITMTFSQSVIKYADSEFLTSDNLTVHQPEYLFEQTLK